MYQRHFAFTRLPFETPAETDELFESNARGEAEARLGHLIELRGIGLLTGEVGSGKTTRLPASDRAAPPGALPRPLRLADHGQRARHVQIHRLGARSAHRALARLGPSGNVDRRTGSVPIGAVTH